MKTSNNWKDLLAGKLEEMPQEEKDALAQAEADKTEVTNATPARKGKLRIELDKHGRKGKPVTLITEFQGDETELARLTKLLQSRVGAGGSHCFNTEDPYDGQILIQGDCRKKVAEILEKEGYKVRLIGM